MLKKSERLNRSTFSNYFASGKRNHGSYLTIITVPAPTLLAAVVVGKKVSKKSPIRNSIKRRIYAQIEELAKSTGFKGVVIVIVKPSVSLLSKRGMKESLRLELGRVIN